MRYYFGVWGKVQRYWMLDVLSAVSNYFGERTPTKVRENQVGDSSVRDLAESNFPVSRWNALLKRQTHNIYFTSKSHYP